MKRSGQISWLWRTIRRSACGLLLLLLAACDQNAPSGEADSGANAPTSFSTAELATETEYVTGQSAEAKDTALVPLWSADTAPEAQLGILEERMLSDNPLSREELLASLHIASPVAQLWILEVLGEQRIHDAATSQIAENYLRNPHTSPALRLAAVALIHPAKDSELWLHSLKIPEESLHQEVVWRLENAPEQNRLRVALGALQTPSQKSRDAAVFLLGGISDKAAVEALIPELDNDTTAVAARDGLFFLLGKDFRSAAEAKEWFERRKPTLSQDLEPDDSFWEIE